MYVCMYLSKMPFTNKDGTFNKSFKEYACEQKLESSLIKSLSE